MNIKLIRGDLAHLDECAGALLDSELGRRYFVTRENCEKAVMEFIPAGTLFCAYDNDGAFAGFVCYIANGAFHAFPYLHIIAVNAHARGKGYGTQIMNQFEKMIFEEKDKLFLVVADFNPRAGEFYLARGYELIGVIPGLYREGIAEYLMMKRKPETE